MLHTDQRDERASDEPEIECFEPRRVRVDDSESNRNGLTGS